MGKSIGKRVVLDAAKTLSPRAGRIGKIIDDVAGLIDNSASRATSKAIGTATGAVGDIALKDLLGSAFAVYSNPTQIADDPMEGAKGFMAEQYQKERVAPYVFGDQVGPAPDSDTQVNEFGKIWENHLQEIDRYAAEKKKKEEEQLKRNLASGGAWAAKQLTGLITGLSGRI